ncbi:MAG: ATP-binding protein [Cellulosilyticaceae bacterium]
MKKKLIMPVIVGMWIVAIILLMYVNTELHQLYETGILTLETLDIITNKIFYSAPIITGICSSIAYVYMHFLLNQVVKPIEELTKEVENFAAKPHYALRQYEFDIINKLAVAFDKSNERYYRTIRKLEYQKSKAESVLNHLEDAVLILDGEGYIVEFNEQSKQYVQLPKSIKHCKIKHLFRDEVAKSMMSAVFEKESSESCEIEKDGKVLHIRMGLIGKKNIRYGYIVTITDLTKTRQLEALRYQFVSNVTHELKTPLTSIQGFIETLQNGAIDNKEVAHKFLSIIDIESKRLYRLIQDILVLAEIENMKEAHGETVNISDILENVYSLLKNEADKKGISFEISGVEKDIYINADKDHVKQVILNLVSNAIRYTDEGKVSVEIKQSDNKAELVVNDTGIGISKDYIGRIFERFYRVDKSRTSKRGGTGLGLSIVKHIAQLYDWEIDVESVEKKGSTFKIIF